MSDDILKDEVKLEGNKLTLSNRDFETVFQLSGSKAKTPNGKRKAIKEFLTEALKSFITEVEKDGKK